MVHKLDKTKQDLMEYGKKCNKRFFGLPISELRQHNMEDMIKIVEKYVKEEELLFN